jgi:hypothetical protein
LRWDESREVERVIEEIEHILGCGVRGFAGFVGFRNVKVESH